MKCSRRILHISYKDHVTNKKVRAKIQQAIGPYEDEDLLAIVKGNKLKWYGRGSRSCKAQRKEEELVGALSPVNHRGLHQGL